jgi:hypothetical protein
MSVWAKAWAYEQHPKRIDDDGNVTDKPHPAAKAVIVALAEFPGPGQSICWPSQSTLSAMTDYDQRTVRRCLKDLEQQGLIRRSERERDDGSRRSDEIELVGPTERFGPPQDAPEDSPDEDPYPPDTLSGGWGHTVRGGGDTLSGHEPSSRNVTGTVTKETTTTDSVGNVAYLDKTITQCLKLLKGIENFPANDDETAQRLMEYISQFEKAEAVAVVRDFTDWLKAEGLRKPSKAYSLLRGAFEHAHQRVVAKEEASQRKVPKVQRWVD